MTELVKTMSRPNFFGHVILLSFACTLCYATSRTERKDQLLKRESTDANAQNCYWAGAQSALIRDTIYIDGGLLWRGETNQNGQLMGSPIPAPIAIVLMPSSPLQKLHGANIVPGTCLQNETNGPKFDNFTRDYYGTYDGSMFANDYTFIRYAGYLPFSDTVNTAGVNSRTAAMYEVYEQGPDRAWQQGYTMTAVTEGTSMFVASGAGVNVRELNQSFYWSGLRDWGLIKGPGIVLDVNVANVTSQQFIQVDLNNQIQSTWSNQTVSQVARPRVNPQMVYVPVGKQGVLVVVGGVLWPDWMRPAPNEQQIEESKSTARSFVQAVEVYDIDSGKWYLQNTTGQMPPLGITQHCTTVASASDGSSHQIYLYGGYSGQDDSVNDLYSDDIYVLSLPAFEWIKVYNSTQTGGGRVLAQCHKVYPDQMFVIGGALQNRHLCISDGFVKVFNLNTLQFQDGYDPAIYSQYKVPGIISQVVGGNADGGATKSTNNWADSALQSIFNEKSTLTAPTWYPYESVTVTSTNTAASPTETKKGGGGLPGFVAPLLASIFGVIIVIVIICFIIYMRRRKRRLAKETAGQSDSSDSKSSPNVIQSWINDVSTAPTEGVSSPTDVSSQYFLMPPGSGVSPGSTGTPGSPITHGQTLAAGFYHPQSPGEYLTPQTGVAHELPATKEYVELPAFEDHTAYETEKGMQPPVPSGKTPPEAPNLPVSNERPPHDRPLLPTQESYGFPSPDQQVSPYLEPAAGGITPDTPGHYSSNSEIKPDSPVSYAPTPLTPSNSKKKWKWSR